MFLICTYQGSYIFVINLNSLASLLVVSKKLISLIKIISIKISNVYQRYKMAENVLPSSIGLVSLPIWYWLRYSSWKQFDSKLSLEICSRCSLPGISCTGSFYVPKYDHPSWKSLFLYFSIVLWIVYLCLYGTYYSICIGGKPCQIEWWITCRC